jgi:hypothetical protein
MRGGPDCTSIGFIQHSQPRAYRMPTARGGPLLIVGDMAKSRQGFYLGCFQDHSDNLRGLPPARVFRRAESCRKCSDPNRRAVSVPPLLPRATAGDKRDCSMKSSVSAMAARRLSRAAPVRFSGSEGLVSKIRSASEIRFRRACKSRFDGLAILLF